VTYQMFSENRCPAHRQKLETKCLHCGQEAPYIINACLVGSPYRCAGCGAPYATRSLPAFGTKPAMRKEHRIAIARHFHNRVAGSFCLGIERLRPVARGLRWQGGALDASDDRRPKTAVCDKQNRILTTLLRFW
jgi:hypothetical protein